HPPTPVTEDMPKRAIDIDVQGHTDDTQRNVGGSLNRDRSIEGRIEGRMGGEKEELGKDVHGKVDNEGKDDIQNEMVLMPKKPEKEEEEGEEKDREQLGKGEKNKRENNPERNESQGHIEEKEEKDEEMAEGNKKPGLFPDHTSICEKEPQDSQVPNNSTNENAKSDSSLELKMTSIDQRKSPSIPRDTPVPRSPRLTAQITAQDIKHIQDIPLYTHISQLSQRKSSSASQRRSGLSAVCKDDREDGTSIHDCQLDCFPPLSFLFSSQRVSNAFSPETPRTARGEATVMTSTDPSSLIMVSDIVGSLQELLESSGRNVQEENSQAISSASFSPLLDGFVSEVRECASLCKSKKGCEKLANSPQSEVLFDILCEGCLLVDPWPPSSPPSVSSVAEQTAREVGMVGYWLKRNCLVIVCWMLMYNEKLCHHLVSKHFSLLTHIVELLDCHEIDQQSNHSTSSTGSAYGTSVLHPTSPNHDETRVKDRDVRTTLGGRFDRGDTRARMLSSSSSVSPHPSQHSPHPPSTPHHRYISHSLPPPQSPRVRMHRIREGKKTHGSTEPEVAETCFVILKQIYSVCGYGTEPGTGLLGTLTVPSSSSSASSAIAIATSGEDEALPPARSSSTISRSSARILLGSVLHSCFLWCEIPLKIDSSKPEENEKESRFACVAACSCCLIDTIFMPTPRLPSTNPMVDSSSLSSSMRIGFSFVDLLPQHFISRLTTCISRLCSKAVDKTRANSSSLSSSMRIGFSFVDLLPQHFISRLTTCISRLCSKAVDKTRASGIDSLHLISLVGSFTTFKKPPTTPLLFSCIALHSLRAMAHILDGARTVMAVPVSDSMTVYGILREKVDKIVKFGRGRSIADRSMDMMKQMMVIVRASCRNGQATRQLWDHDLYGTCISICEEAQRRKLKMFEETRLAEAKKQQENEKKASGTKKNKGKEEEKEKEKNGKGKKDKKETKDTSTKIEEEVSPNIACPSLPFSNLASYASDILLLSVNILNPLRKKMSHTHRSSRGSFSGIPAPVVGNSSSPTRLSSSSAPPPVVPQFNPFSSRCIIENDEQEDEFGRFYSSILTQRMFNVLHSGLVCNDSWTASLIQVLFDILPFDISVDQRRVVRLSGDKKQSSQSAISNCLVSSMLFKSSISIVNLLVKNALGLKAHQSSSQLTFIDLFPASPAHVYSVLGDSGSNSDTKSRKKGKDKKAPNPSLLSASLLTTPGNQLVYLGACVKILRVVCQDSQEARDYILKKGHESLVSLCRLCGEDIGTKRAGLWKKPSAYIADDLLQILSYIFTSRNMSPTFISMPVENYCFALSTTVSKSGEQGYFYESPESRAFHSQTAFVRLIFSILRRPTRSFILQLLKNDEIIAYFARVFRTGQPSKLFRGVCRIMRAIFCFVDKSVSSSPVNVDDLVKLSGSNASFEVLGLALVSKMKSLIQIIRDCTPFDANNKESFACVCDLLVHSQSLRDLITDVFDEAQVIVEFLRVSTHPSVSRDILDDVLQVVVLFSTSRHDVAAVVLDSLLKQTSNPDRICDHAISVLLQCLLTSQVSITDPLFQADEMASLYRLVLPISQITLPKPDHGTRKELSKIEVQTQCINLVLNLEKLYGDSVIEKMQKIGGDDEISSCLAGLLTGILESATRTKSPVIERGLIDLFEKCLKLEWVMAKFRTLENFIPIIFEWINMRLHIEEIKTKTTDSGPIHEESLELTERLFACCMVILNDLSAPKNKYKFKNGRSNLISFVIKNVPNSHLDSFLLACIQSSSSIICELGLDFCSMMCLHELGGRVLCNLIQLCKEMYSITKTKGHSHRKKVVLLMKAILDDPERKKIFKENVQE
ncbi:hypothetical protein ADUPG1_006966, partial [Aduncisulcus paluster]